MIFEVSLYRESSAGGDELFQSSTHVFWDKRIKLRRVISAGYMLLQAYGDWHQEAAPLTPAFVT